MSKLPKGWEIVNMMEFIYFVPTGILKFSGKRKYYSTGSINGKSHMPEGEYSYDNRPSRANRTAAKGDVFQARMQGTDKALLVQESIEGQLFSTGFLQLRPIANTYDSKLLFYFVKSDFFLKQRDEFATGSTQIALTDTNAKKLKLIVPPLAEQRRIVAKLEKLLHRVDACKERLEKIPVILKRFRQSVLNAACSGRLTKDWREKNPEASVKFHYEPIICHSEPFASCHSEGAERPKNLAQDRLREESETLRFTQGDNDNNRLPESWIVTPLKNLSEGFQYGTSAKSQKSGKVPVIRMGNIQNGKIDWTDLVYTSNIDEIKKFHLKQGDVLFNRTNSPELVGKTGIYRGEQPAIFAGYLIRIKNKPELNSDFLNYCLNTSFAREWCHQVKTDGVSQSNINAQKLAQFPIPLPPLPEQHEIVRRVEELFKKAEEIESRYKKAKAFVDKLTQSILAKAFRGELVPQDPNDEPASVLLERIKAEKEKIVKTNKKSNKKRK